MKAEELFWTDRAGWSRPARDVADAQLVLYFGAREQIASGDRFAELQRRYRKAVVAGCSTGGQIFAGDVSDDLVAAVAFRFARTEIAVVEKSLEESPSSFAAGASLAAGLMRPDLKCIFVLSDGIHVNGSDLVAGILSAIGPGVTVTGGLAGDGTRFSETVVGAGRPPMPKQVIAIGFYGSAIAIGNGSAGGWDEFGPKRRISKSLNNVLFALDDEPALDLYERYLGDEASGLPGTALLYPLLVADPAHPAHGVVRTVLGINRDERSMTFAGNIPQGWSAQLMYGHFDRLAEGAASAARQVSSAARNGNSEEVAVLVSCIGRRILMGQSIVDEIAQVEANIGTGVRKIGFYSYGEISPHSVSGVCDLHNQTMTVTTIAEHCD
jgi:hypothetical protein